MFHPHMLILAAHVLLRATISTVQAHGAGRGIGTVQHIDAAFPDIAVCTLVGDEIAAAAPTDDVAFTCTMRFAA